MKTCLICLACLLASLSVPDSFASDGAAGDYVQDTNITEAPSTLYNPSLGFHFDGSDLWGRGDFTSFLWSGNNPPARTEAGLLVEGTYNNIHSFACYSQSSLTGLVNPSHDMEEQISIDSDQLSYYEPGNPSNCSKTLRLSIPKNSVSYTVYTDYIPLERITTGGGCAGVGCYKDLEYRGQLLFLGENYFVKDVDGDRIYLDKGTLINATSSGYSAEYKGYRFKVAQVITDSSYWGTHVILDVQKPDGSVVQVQSGCTSFGAVDNLEITTLSNRISGQTQKADIMVYDTSTEVVLEDGEDLEMGGHVWVDWEVFLDRWGICEDAPDCNIAEYDDMGYSYDGLLRSITLSYNHDLTGNRSLGVNDSLAFPNNFRLRFKGYMNQNYRGVSCPVTGQVYSTYFIGTSEPGMSTTTSSTTTTVYTTTTSSTTTTPPCGAPNGRNAVGDYVQDVAINEPPSYLYNPSLGLHFDGSKSYEYGDLTSYTWCAQTTTRSMANLPLQESADNVDSMLCYRGASPYNSAHDMSERIDINSSALRYYEPGNPSACSKTLKLAIPNGSVSYTIETDYIPLKDILKDSWFGCAGADCLIDTEYRGAIPYMGEEYYVKDVSGSKIYLDKGTVLTNVSNSGWDASYLGYKFKVSSISTSGACNSIVLSVQKPSGATVQVTVSGTANGLVDSLEIAGNSWQLGGTWQQASITVYNLSTEVVLEDGKDVIVRGQTKTGWKAHYATINHCYFDDYASDGSWNDCSIGEYDDMNYTTGGLLKSIHIAYERPLSGAEALGVNQSLNFPDRYRLTFRGYLDTDYRSCAASGTNYATYFLGTGEQSTATTTSTSTTRTTTTTSTTTTAQGECNMPGDAPPCGTVTLSEVVSYITMWSGGQAQLGDVVALIGAWSG